MSTAGQGGTPLRIEGVCKHYGTRRVLEGFSLELAAGEFFGLVGVNGAGKTTCMKGLLDFAAIDGGTTEIFGIPHTRTASRARLAFLPERFLPPYYLTGADFLRYMARLQGVSYTPESARGMCNALDLAPEALDRPVRDYSKGMAQKLGLVGCFLADRELLILDEPMSGLDPKARLLVKRHLIALKERGRALFFSTHLLADIDEVCDRMGILHEGRLRFVGTPAECRARFGSEQLEHAYLNCISQSA